PSAAPSAAASASAAPSAAAIENELFIYNWSDYIAPENITAFEAMHNTTITYDTFANNEELLAKLQGGASGYDLACPTAEFLVPMIEEGFIEKLDPSRLPNMAHIDPALLSQKWDPNNEYHVPKDFGTTGILVRKKVVTEPITSWREFYDLTVGKYSGRTVMVDSLGDVLIMPLKMLGYSLNETDPAKLDEARKLLTDLAPHILALDSDTYQDKLASEEAVLCLGWTGPLLELKDNPETADVEYVVPSEGTLFWLDTWVKLADAPHPNAAYEWLNWIQDPEVQAKETEFNGYATPNLEAKKLVSQALLDDPAIFPPADVMASLEGADPAVTDDEGRLALWADFKSAIG
ncbi:MAG: spermidine/putrescine ABC transporter substrate-binding protein, partial [Chloroflexi bacterium]|nr:spermidine/putrescine ABC transporter substrate-binding protein [Chloroflexota bacterium]